MHKNPILARIDLDDGYIPLSHDWLRAFTQSVITAGQRRLADLIARMTYGEPDWHSTSAKKIKRKVAKAPLSISAMAEATGVDRRRVTRDLATLVGLGIVLVERQRRGRGFATSLYCLNPDLASWQPAAWRHGEPLRARKPDASGVGRGVAHSRAPTGIGHADAAGAGHAPTGIGHEAAAEAEAAPGAGEPAGRGIHAPTARGMDAPSLYKDQEFEKDSERHTPLTPPVAELAEGAAIAADLGLLDELAQGEPPPAAREPARASRRRRQRSQERRRREEATAATAAITAIAGDLPRRRVLTVEAAEAEWLARVPEAGRRAVERQGPWPEVIGRLARQLETKYAVGAVAQLRGLVEAELAGREARAARQGASAPPTPSGAPPARSGEQHAALAWPDDALAAYAAWQAADGGWPELGEPRGC